MRGPGLRLSRREVLSLAALELAACAGEYGVPSSMWNWNRDFPPYRVIENIYFVGSTQLAQFLITTPQGHILIDSGFENSVPRLRENIAKLGLRFADIKIMLCSHAHIDHVQAHAIVRQLTHAQVIVAAPDVPFIASGGHGETVFDGIYAWRPCPVDRTIVDGDQVSLGGSTLTARLTPGHTKGATTWTMQIPHASRRLDVVFFPSANINPGVRLVGNARYPDIARDFEHSFAVWKALPCDVFLGAHGEFYDMRRKFDRLESQAEPNPFIDPKGYRKTIADAEQRFREQLASERE
jgi:metallo-beta-lactamase class B